MIKIVNWSKIEKITVSSVWDTKNDTNRYYVNLIYYEIPSLSFVFRKYMDAMLQAELFMEQWQVYKEQQKNKEN